jgi:hypothetical protein
MKRTILLVVLTLAFVILPAVPAAAQTTYNLDIIWHCPKPDTFPWGLWGYSIASGDFNNDSYIDLVTYARYYKSPKIYWKKYFYTSNPLDTIPEIIINDSLGGSPSALCTGDFNGDGVDDLAISDPVGWDTLGRIDIYYGRALFDLTPDTAIHGPVVAKGSEFGRAIARGDVNGDGIDDLVVGAYWGGGVFVYYGDTLGIHTIHDIRLRSKYSENFGMNVASGGDMNGDGFDEIAVGAPFNPESVGGGKIYIYQGGNPMDTLPDAWMYGETGGAMLGEFDIAIVPNANGNYATGWWGTPYEPPTIPSPGKMYWLFGEDSVDNDYDLSVPGYYYDSGIGQSSAYAGDIDSNKYGDFVSGTIYEGGKRGAAYVWLGRSNMTSVCDAYMIGVDSADLNGRLMALGSYVTTVGDVNKDGKDEFAVSNYAGNYTLSAIWICKYTGPYGVAEKPVMTVSEPCLKLFQNAPNPCTRQTTISYQLARQDQVSLKIYNTLGQVVKTLVNESQNPGPYSVKWNGNDEAGRQAAAGIYFYRLVSGEFNSTKKMVVLR